MIACLALLASACASPPTVVTDERTVDRLPPAHYLDPRDAPEVAGPRNRDLEDAYEACRVVVDAHNEDKAQLREWRAEYEDSDE